VGAASGAAAADSYSLELFRFEFSLRLRSLLQSPLLAQRLSGAPKEPCNPHKRALLRAQVPC